MWNEASTFIFNERICLFVYFYDNRVTPNDVITFNTEDASYS